MEYKKYPTERNLDGCYFRIEREGQYCNMCFTDLTKEEQEKILEDKGVQWLKGLVHHLSNALRNVGDSLDIEMELR